LTDCDVTTNVSRGTADNGTETTTVDAERTEADDYWNGWYIKFTSGSNNHLVRLIIDFDAGSDTITHLAFPNAVQADDTYLLITATGWVEERHNMDDADATLEVVNGDVFKVTCIADDENTHEYGYYRHDLINQVSTDLYTRWLVRYKTSVSANGFSAKTKIFFTDDSSQCLVASDEEYDKYGKFSTEWTVASGDLTSGKKIDNVRFYFVKHPDSLSSGISYVYWDFLLLHKNTFTFPNVGKGMQFRPPPKYAVIPIFGRVGDITQGGGSESAVVTCSCDLDVGDDWKRPQGDTTKTDYVNAEVFYEIAHRSYTEPWQWLDTGSEQFKATLESPVFRRGGDGHHILDLLFREYRLSCASNEYYYERFGLNL